MDASTALNSKHLILNYGDATVSYRANVLNQVNNLTQGENQSPHFAYNCQDIDDFVQSPCILTIDLCNQSLRKSWKCSCEVVVRSILWSHRFGGTTALPLMHQSHTIIIENAIDVRQSEYNIHLCAYNSGTRSFVVDLCT